MPAGRSAPAGRSCHGDLICGRGKKSFQPRKSPEPCTDWPRLNCMSIITLVLTALICQEPKLTIPSEGTWEYRSGEAKSIGRWVALSELKGMFCWAEPTREKEKRFWILDGFPMSFLPAGRVLIDLTAERWEIYRVCNNGCGKPGTKPYEHYVSTYQIEHTLTIGKKWEGHWTQEGCVVAAQPISYHVIAEDPVGDYSAWKIEVNFDGFRGSNLGPGYIWVSPDVGIVKTKDLPQLGTLELVKYTKDSK